MPEITLESAPLSEQFLLASALLHPEKVNWLFTAIPDKHFFTNGFYARVYDEIRELTAQGKVADIGSLFPSFPNETGELSEITSTLPDELWIDSSLSQRQFDTHASLVKEAWVKRETRLALERGDAMADILSRIATTSATGHDQVFNGVELVKLITQAMSNNQARIPFHLSMLNTATSGGLRAGELCIVAARQGGGKSAFLQQAALHALKQGKRVLFASGEMTPDDLAGRWITQLTHQQVLRNETYDASLAALGMAEIEGWGDRLVVHALTNVKGVEDSLRDANGEIDIVFVDYLQKLSPISSRARSEYERVSEVSRTLDNLAQEYRVPMMVAAQFNRNAEGQQPSIADLRDSGQIEADADMVLSLWGKPEEQTDPSKAKVYCDILKNRNGFTFKNTPGGEYALWFDKPHFSFAEIEYRQKDPTPYEEAQAIFGEVEMPYADS